MKKNIFLFLGVVILITAIILIISPDSKEESPILGGDKDEYGCIGSAGYSWCEEKQKCLRTWEEKCEEEGLGVNKSVFDDNLGIKVSYYSNPENQTRSKIDGNRIYFYIDRPMSVSDYKSGQYLEKFSKEINTTLQEAIENDFLQNINNDQCFVEIIEDNNEYQKAIINYPDNPCPNGEPFFACNNCPENYSKTNGISYFMYYKDHPETYFYFSIGQYSLIMENSETSSDLEWFNNIEFIK